ncbi:hypothetical protein KW419_12950 [Vibrio fluvialis]|uniref:hypothetical protein n=1 Tax=Vibrio fluvialis TaxID=676 RepID=UPI001C9BC05E|nr:hypothetical protein [Vibrio fluvialis]MBY7859152.1 hypothetical protein [Vibrio fluvialis]MBY7899960.1 hypothetical protein [Vibrio fluvialis]MBY7938559.1 hypothetical protein [Vibrio fluvialis]MBY8230286.1 hypothetical protein [Vibrio fluvialis]MCG6363841.1 hypothetical protein [Vibrio fluvialis]
MRTLKPKQYIDEFYPDSGMCAATIINWIKRGKIKGTTTPTGRWLVLIDNNTTHEDKTSELLQFLES